MAKRTTATKATQETNLIRRATVAKTAKPALPKFRAGDTVGVYVKVREGEKERVQLYKGVVIKMQGAGMSRSFTVRKISSGIGVERTFPFYSPAIERVEIVTHGQVRRGKLMYLRELAGKAATIEADVTAQNEMMATEAAARADREAAARAEKESAKAAAAAAAEENSSQS